MDHPEPDGAAHQSSGARVREKERSYMALHPNPTPDKATPAWSRDLAVLSRPSAVSQERWRAFLESAVQYATYEDMPPELKAIYDTATRQLQQAQRQSRHR